MTGLLDALQQVSGQSVGAIAAAALVFMRVGAIMALLPGFGEQSVPARVRLVLALAFTLVVAPTVIADMPESGWFTAAGIEAGAGLVMGVGLRLMIMALQTAAVMMAQASSLSQLMAGAGPEPMPAIGQLLTVAGLALAMTAGLHVRAAQFMMQSYLLVPPGQWPNVAQVSTWGVAQVAHAFALAFALAAPFTIAALVYNLALGAINRAMPALMVSFIGAPLLAGGAMVMLALLSPVLLGVWWQALAGFLANPAGTAP